MLVKPIFHVSCCRLNCIERSVHHVGASVVKYQPSTSCHLLSTRSVHLLVPMVRTATICSLFIPTRPSLHPKRGHVVRLFCNSSCESPSIKISASQFMPLVKSHSHNAIKDQAKSCKFLLSSPLPAASSVQFKAWSHTHDYTFLTFYRNLG